jgi:hypothetical protein
LEQQRGSAISSRNVRLTAIRSAPTTPRPAKY